MKYHVISGALDESLITEIISYGPEYLSERCSQVSLLVI